MLNNLINDKTIYISYASGESDELKDIIKMSLKMELKKNGYQIIDYKDLNDSGEQYNIDDLILRIGNGLYVVIIIDKKYLVKSIYTIKEICALTQRGDLPNRVFPIYSDDSLVAYEMSIKEKDNLLKESIETINNNMSEEDISSRKNVENEDLSGCKTPVTNFLNYLDKNVNWAYTNSQYNDLVQAISKKIKYSEKLKQPNMLTPISSIDLKSNARQGGNIHTEKNFIYTDENRHLFFERKIVNTIIKQLKPKASKAVHIIYGKDGSGKTTMLRQIMDKLLKDDKNKIYFNGNGDTSSLIDGLEYLDNDESENYIVVIDKLKFRNVDDLSEILDMVKNENKFHLVLSVSDRQYSDNNPIEKYKEYTNFNNIKEYISDDYNGDWETILEVYENNFSQMQHRELLSKLARESKPLAYIASIIYTDDSLDEAISKDLKEKKDLLNEYEYNFIDIVSVLYFFTSKGQELWFNDVFMPRSIEENIISLLYDEDMLTYDEYTFKGISPVYDAEVLSIIVKEYFNDDEDSFFTKVLETYFKFFNRLFPILSYKKINDFNKLQKRRFEIELFNNLDQTLSIINIHDLFDIKNIIIDSEYIKNDVKYQFLEKLITKFYSLKIEDMKAFKKCKYFYEGIRDYYIRNNLEYKFNNLNFNTRIYYYSKDYKQCLDLNKLVHDYEENYNITSYVIANLFFDAEQVESHIEVNQLTDETKEKIDLILRKLYDNISVLSPIDTKVFFNLLGYKSLYADSREFETSSIDIALIYKSILNKYRFDSRSFDFTTKRLYSLDPYLIKASFFDIEHIIDSQLKGDFVIFDFLISKNLLEREKIPKVLEYFLKYYRGKNPILTYKIFSLYNDHTKQYFESKYTEELVRWAVNVAYRDMTKRSKEKLQSIPPESWLGTAMHTEYRANILKYISDNKLNSLAQKYINIFATSDWARNRKKEHRINYNKYYNILFIATEDLYKMLYYEHKTFVNKRNLEEYASYCANQKSKGFSFLYMRDEDEYRRYRDRAIIIFDVLSNFYLENKNLEYPTNIVANILKTIDTKEHKFKAEIKRLFMIDINNRKSEQHEKSIMDLTNYYKDINSFFEAEKIISVAIENGLINRYDNIGHLPALLKEIKCSKEKISELLNYYSIKYEIDKVYEGTISNITKEIIFVRMPMGLSGVLYKNKMRDDDIKQCSHRGKKIVVKIQNNKNGRIKLVYSDENNFI